ncbi:hypothetical protein GCM10008955_38020 [Deinococcus malanensis]|uniref:DUF3302 domain-containing protein n=1 Tax=Deinococcus malanensis TaxID=1706855 RepID=A0ABQ2F259_9DEIO|nr:hypothetical protein GCM10008955_38020 [Deinococcus malanensis]
MCLSLGLVWTVSPKTQSHQRMVATQVVSGILSWIVPGGMALLLGVWWVIPILHERQVYHEDRSRKPNEENRS